MRRSGVGSGGGIGSRPVTHVSAPKVEPRAHAKNPGGVAQYGSAIGNKATSVRGETSYRGDPVNIGRGYEPPGMISDPVKAVGVGGGRTVYHCGSQDTHGQTNPGNPRSVPSRHILSSYGPDKSRS